MGRVSELLDWLAGRPPACESCGTILVSLAAAGGARVVICTCCDRIPPAPADHAAIHPLPGFAWCVDCRATYGALV